MQCPGCAFENMPGTEVCVRCGALLEVGTVNREELRPPRAGKRKPARFRYYLNRLRDRFRGIRPKWLRVVIGDIPVPSESLSAMVYSIIPGLGHLMRERRRGAAVAFGVWISILLIAVNFYLGNRWWIAFSILLSWHAQVVFDAGEVGKATPRIIERLRVMACVLLILGTGYVIVNATTQRFFDVESSWAEVSALDLQVGDLVSVESRGIERAGLKAYDVVSFSASGFEQELNENNRSSFRRRFSQTMISPILAVGLDRVTVGPEGVRVNGRRVATGMIPESCAEFPVEVVSFTLPEGSFLIAYPVVLRRQDEAIGRYLWTRGYVIPASRIQGIALGVVLPLWRWHSFASMEIQNRG